MSDCDARPRPAVAFAFALVLLALLAAACSPARAPTPAGTASRPPTVTSSVSVVPTEAPVPQPTSAPPSTAVPSDLPVLTDGAITPARYTFAHDAYAFVQDVPCDGPAIDCPPEGASPSPLLIEVTIPPGWEAMFGGLVVHPGATEGPTGAALVLGWTSYWVGINSDPCLQVAHQMPDIRVGPTVGEFVDAVVAHPKLDVSKPVDVELGGYRGKFFSVTGPSDIGGCDNWRPWDPGFYMQGPDNLWDVWVVDVDGLRVLIVTEQFAGTPEDVKSELREMVDSIRFVP